MSKKYGKYVGAISVGSGICWVGDPADIIHSDNKLPKSLGKSWQEFVNKLFRFKKVSVKTDGGAMVEVPHFSPLQAKQFKGDNGSFLGVGVSTGYGDGIYPVYVDTVKDSKGNPRVKSVTVVFIEED